ncbi:hypothetical protein V2J09_020965 [Rumex salicifolius]
MVNDTVFCYETAVSPLDLWGDETPLLNALPHLVTQMALAIASNLFFLFILRPFRQPRIVVDLLSALAISPIVLDMINKELSSESIWPRKGKTNMEMLSNMGLLYTMFIKGLQMDMTPVSNRRGLKTLLFSMGIIVLPFLVGSTISGIFAQYEVHHFQSPTIFIFWGAVMASSCFATVASILARLKLLCTDIGRSALCIGMINDLGSWLFIVIIVAMSARPPVGDPDGSSWDPFFTVMLFALCFWLLCFAVIRPLLLYAISHNKEGENFSDSAIHVILFMVMAAGLLAEFFGAYAFLGAFLLGICIPHGFLAQTLAEKMEDCVSALLMPLYFVSIGLMMKGAQFSSETLTINIALIVVAVLVKPICVFLVSVVCGIPTRDGLAISVLLNCKGLLSVVIASVGYERGHLTSEAVAVLVCIVLTSTMVVEPVMLWSYNRMLKPTQPYDRRTVGGLKQDDDFRVISCIQSSRNIPGMTNILDISHVSHVFALHLMELIGRTSAMLIVHESNTESTASPFYNKTRAQSDQIVTAFENYERRHNGATSVQTLTIVSPMETMHEDVCNLAEDKQVSMILLPFHKQQGMDGKLEDDGNMEIRSVNQNVMARAPCSTALLIDRGIGMIPVSGSSSVASATTRSGRLDGDPIRVAMFYFGGPDDREALSYSVRLATHETVALTIVRFIAGSNPVDVEPIVFPGDEEDEDETGVPTVYTEHDYEKQTDNNCIKKLIQRSNAESPVEYVQLASNSGADTVAMLREMDHQNFDLYVVGRGQGVLSPTTAGLIEWSECPELGAIGDVLVTSDFAADVSVVVVQQYAGARSLPPKDSAVIDF